MFLSISRVKPSLEGTNCSDHAGTLACTKTLTAAEEKRGKHSFCPKYTLLLQHSPLLPPWGQKRRAGTTAPNTDTGLQKAPGAAPGAGSPRTQHQAGPGRARDTCCGAGWRSPGTPPESPQQHRHRDLPPPPPAHPLRGLSLPSPLRSAAGTCRRRTGSARRPGWGPGGAAQARPVPRTERARPHGSAGPRRRQRRPGSERRGGSISAK